MPSDDVGPSEHNGASPKQGESGRLAVEQLCTEIGMCGVVKRRRCEQYHITSKATKEWRDQSQSATVAVVGGTDCDCACAKAAIH